MAPVVKNLPANAGDTRDTSSVTGLGRSPAEGNGDPLQFSCLENPTDRGAWGGYSPWDCKKLDKHTHTHIHTYIHTES